MNRSFQSAPVRLLTALAAGVIVLLLISSGCRSPDPDHRFNGTELSEEATAPTVRLTNQFGEPVSLNSFAGRTVVLTFLYTNCPNVCPIVTNQLRGIHRELGDDAERVEFLAVSVDPERDTVDAARKYLTSWELVDDWQFLVGSRGELEPIWEAYYIDPTIDDADVAAQISARPASGPRGAVDALSSQISQKFLVIHSTPVYLIDSDGVRRVVFTAPLEPDEILQDIQNLIN